MTTTINTMAAIKLSSRMNMEESQEYPGRALRA